jgi:hypothetical protein
VRWSGPLVGLEIHAYMSYTRRHPAMTDPAESHSLFPVGDDDSEMSPPRLQSDRVLSAAPVRSYIDELRARVDSLPDDEGALMVPPDARPVRWVASDIEAALRDAAEIVPRSPSSPDSVLPPSMAPLPAASLRNVRRPQDESVGRTAGEFAPLPSTTLPAHERGRKSGRFVAPAGLRDAAGEQPGPLAAALVELINTESLESEPAVAPAPVAVSAVVTQDTLIDADSAAAESIVTIAMRGLLLFVTAWIAGGTTVYFLLRG